MSTKKPNLLSLVIGSEAWRAEQPEQPPTSKCMNHQKIKDGKMAERVGFYYRHYPQVTVKPTLPR
jgi:hypothetical protein